MLGVIHFYWLPSAITRRTLPQFIAIDDEPLARAQRRVLTAHLARQQQAHGEIPLTMAMLDEQILKSREDLFESEAEALEIKAKKLLLLLDPNEPTDLTENGRPIDPSWEGLADNLPVEIIEAVTEKIIEVCHAPFKIGLAMPPPLLVSGAASSST